MERIAIVTRKLCTKHVKMVAYFFLSFLFSSYSVDLYHSTCKSDMILFCDVFSLPNFTFIGINIRQLYSEAMPASFVVIYITMV